MLTKGKARRAGQAGQLLTAIAMTVMAQLHIFIYEGKEEQKIDFARALRTDRDGQRRVQLDFAWSSALGPPPKWLVRKARARARRFAELVESGNTFSGWTLINRDDARVIIGFP